MIEPIFVLNSSATTLYFLLGLQDVFIELLFELFSNHCLFFYINENIIDLNCGIHDS